MHGTNTTHPDCSIIYTNGTNGSDNTGALGVYVSDVTNGTIVREYHKKCIMVMVIMTINQPLWLQYKQQKQHHSRQKHYQLAPEHVLLHRLLSEQL